MNYSDALKGYGPKCLLDASKYFDSETLAENVNSYSLSKRSPYFSAEHGKYAEGCSVILTGKMSKKLKDGTAKLQIVRMGQKDVVDDVHILLGDYVGSVQIIIGSSGKVVLGACGALNIDIRLGHNGTLTLGDHTTANGVRFISINNNICVGKDCMFSDEVLLQGFDQHGILDLPTKKFINITKKNITIESHVWVGRRATIISGISIGMGSIVGACAVVTKNVPQSSAVAGNPARLVRENVSWSRSWIEIDIMSSDYVEFLR